MKEFNTDREFLQEIEAWLSFNSSPTQEQILQLKTDLQKHLSVPAETLVSQAASQAMPEPCEWEQQEYYYTTSCNNDNSYRSIVDHFDLDNWKHCPYCGKLIHKLL